MLQILGYLLLIGLAILLLKFSFAILLRCCIGGILAFLIIGAVSGALCLLGYIQSDTAWTVSKWAFYIGTALSTVNVICHPFRTISEAWNDATDDSGSSTSYTNTYDSSEKEDEDLYKGQHCCGNCRWNTCPGRVGVSCHHDVSGAYMETNDRCSDYLHF